MLYTMPVARSMERSISGADVAACGVCTVRIQAACNAHGGRLQSVPAPRYVPDAP